MLKNKKSRPGRPRIQRCVRRKPGVKYFKPQGPKVRPLPEVRLTIEECEALCFADRQGLYQAQAARRMGVSRQTFGNIIESARKKTAEAILCGRPLRISGGDYRVAKMQEHK